MVGVAGWRGHRALRVWQNVLSNKSLMPETCSITCHMQSVQSVYIQLCLLTVYENVVQEMGFTLGGVQCGLERSLCIRIVRAYNLTD